ncbi:hypothetical protein ACJX0J_009418, partial [Zea mays]
INKLLKTKLNKLHKLKSKYQSCIIEVNKQLSCLDILKHIQALPSVAYFVSIYLTLNLVYMYSLELNLQVLVFKLDLGYFMDIILEKPSTILNLNFLKKFMSNFGFWKSISSEFWCFFTIFASNHQLDLHCLCHLSQYNFKLLPSFTYYLDLVRLTLGWILHYLENILQTSLEQRFFSLKRSMVFTM